MKRTLTMAVIAAAVLLGLGITDALASIPDSAGVIHGCLNKKGAVSVIHSDNGQTCPSGSAALNWNQTGPQGAQGVQGAQGAPGIAGAHVVVKISRVGGLTQAARICDLMQELNLTVSLEDTLT